MATIYDVAKAAGVSPKTVSRVMNGDAPVNEKTREAVEAAMLSLNYVPSSAARTMRSQRSGLIGMITGAISTTHHFEDTGLPEIYLVQGAQRVIAQSNRTLLIADSGGQVDRIPALLQTFREHRVEGVLYVAEYHREVSLPANLRDRPMVLVNCFDADETPAVLPDDAGGQFTLVDGLIKRGHRRIGFLTLPEQQIASGLRMDGYRRALESNGIAFNEQLVQVGALANAAHEFDLLWDALDRVLRAEPTVICCANDKMAMRVYGLLRERGMAIPRDISVAGYDDYRMIAEHLHPGLTSAQLPYAAMGARAADKLLRLIAGTQRPGEPAHELVSGPVAWRDSVQPRDTTITQLSTRRKDI
ncbi:MULTISPECIES: LacI family DNA-binding transcriptional regulator [unclassified Devosia]|uniref:LacI family DNA-binding transcriptional regulator n=1 Tax=unclassified Devosia TaxID=196773 RepID=UPI0007157952|nr:MULTISPECIES: LacI family DNA-binding transcriptional regulator [unclassified Devosia]KQN75174.1 LacI family transcriptional regulator [Devosia sp. Leaf64]KQT46986.1 LacI family transcriptional regulator [Devosia sp. Leaf420]